MYLINNYFLFRVVTFLVVYTYTLSFQEAHCEAEVILKVIKKINLQKVHPNHHLLFKRPVLILPETAYFPRGSFMLLGRTCFMQAQLLGNQTLAGQYTTQYISLFPYLSKGNLFEFGELGNEYAHKYLYHDEFIKIYRKYESLDEWENHDFFFINPQKSIRAIKINNLYFKCNFFSRFLFWFYGIGILSILFGCFYFLPFIGGVANKKHERYENESNYLDAWSGIDRNFS